MRISTVSPQRHLWCLKCDRSSCVKNKKESLSFSPQHTWPSAAWDGRDCRFWEVTNIVKRRGFIRCWTSCYEFAFGLSFTSVGALCDRWIQNCAWAVFLCKLRGQRVHFCSTLNKFKSLNLQGWPIENSVVKSSTHFDSSGVTNNSTDGSGNSLYSLPINIWPEFLPFVNCNLTGHVALLVIGLADSASSDRPQNSWSEHP